MQSERMQEAREKTGLGRSQYRSDPVPLIPDESMPIGFDAASVRNHPAGLKAR